MAGHEEVRWCPASLSLHLYGVFAGVRLKVYYASRKYTTAINNN